MIELASYVEMLTRACDNYVTSLSESDSRQQTAWARLLDARISLETAKLRRAAVHGS